MTAVTTADEVVWRPPAELVAASNLQAFMRQHGAADYGDLLTRADAEPDWFWRAILDRVVFARPYEKLIDESRGAAFPTWCLGGRTNAVLSCIERHRSGPVWGQVALIHESERGEVRRWTYAELSREINALANGLRAIGCERGQVIGLYMPNLPEAIAAFLAIAKIGAIVLPLFSGFGASALATRLTDAGATAVITADGTRRRGAFVPLKATLDQAAPNVPSLARVVVLRSMEADVPMSAGRDYDYADLLRECAGDSATELVEADAPLMLMYTSGTTGKPKGTVHSHVGFVAKMALDMELMLDLKPSDRLLWISDMGWLVGPMIAVGTTFVGAGALLVEGGPDYPDPGRLWRLVDEHAITFLGMAPTIARAFIKANGAGIGEHDLSTLRIVASTGEVWTPEAWHWTFDNVCRGRVPILNYSGGTEIGGGILTGTVLHAMKPCAFAAPIPGMGADVVDEAGRSVPPGTVGELVLRRPSIGLSRSLWQDDARFLESYWEALPGLWQQGDWALVDDDGFWFIRGRSDDTLKIAGKRTGPSEIEGLLTGTGKVVEAATIGVPDPVKGQAVGCVVTLMPGAEWNEALRRELEDAVVRGLGSPYRPSFIVPVQDLPKTRNMKVMRRVVRAACLGHEPGDLSSLVNPEIVPEIARAVSAAAPALARSGQTT